MIITASHWLGQQSPFLADAGNGHRLHCDVVAAFIALQGAAEQDGVDCQLTSSFRSFDRQLSIWNRKWQGELPLYNADGILLDTASLTEDERIEAILTWSALPGGSRHHWGTDMDVYDENSVNRCGHRLELVDAEYQPGGPCFELAQWLEQNCEAYGFYRPFRHYTGGVARELWHLSHRATASQFEALRSKDALASALAESDLLGKESVLARFDELYRRYVLNRGVAL
ncbi:D-alanyl-D-alanine carboxypeptidase family protein [Alteromonas aestuariivivens]|uniref:D-alanyl-D-alanine carboxypeptidase family protein n=1 Tax=Alteromonas aestuariivivens TaxID=1938339 RepID=A0A3D8MCZ6_9ALTE|nr:M15 family metallopeptidase [Alteromonas aestuariivivens]RDV27553.1 D-alanyl-D-alanine carboxypeptidase family protein [Alteromonas aestuariivivens]